MNDQQRVARVEGALSDACAKAIAGGVALIRGDFQLIVPCSWDRRESVVLGACALGAYDLFGGDVLGIEGDDRDRCDDGPWEAIEMGWDGEAEWRKKHRKVAPWYDLGARLAAKYQPVSVSTLEAR